MNIRHLILAGSVLAGSIAGAQTITVNYGNSNETLVMESSSGTALPAGSLVWLGSFAAGTNFATTNFAYLSGQFTQYDTAVISEGYKAGTAGYFAAEAQAPLSTKLSMWVFNTSAAPAATEWGIFSNSGSLWTTQSTGPDVLMIDVDQLGMTAQIGSLGSGFAMTSPVPEPATYAAILGLVTLGLVGYRRFRRS